MRPRRADHAERAAAVRVDRREQVLHLGFGRIVALEIAAPNMLANPV